MAERKPISLALQGGGAHGAFTWGVLHRLLDEPRLVFEAISGTSAGSMNGALLAQALSAGDNSAARQAARRLLEQFWRRVSDAQPFQSLLQGVPGLTLSPTMQAQLMQPWMLGAEIMRQFFSPYQLNPLGYNPLEDILAELIDCTTLGQSAVRLYVTATNVRTGQLKIFADHELSTKALLASACLPFLFQAVEINGDAYWDGGYMGNPTLQPLIRHCLGQDLVVVQINPMVRETVPTSASAILDRVNEISFNSSLLIELKGLAMVNRLLQENGIGNHCGLRQLHLHLIADNHTMSGLDHTSKLITSWDFLIQLKQAGEIAADKWLAANYDKIGKASSCDALQLAS